MSYLVTPNWIGFDGQPITGVMPPRLRLMSGFLTPTLSSEVAHRYRIFQMNRQTSKAAYLVSDMVLADGSRVRIVSNGTLEDVLVWAANTDTRDTKIPPIAYPVLIDLAFAPIYDRPVIDWDFTPEEYPPEPVFDVPYPVMKSSGAAISAKLISASLEANTNRLTAYFETTVVVTLSGASQAPIVGSASYANDGTITLFNCPISPEWFSGSSSDPIAVPYDVVTVDGVIHYVADVRSNYSVRLGYGITADGASKSTMRWRPPTYQLELVSMVGVSRHPPQAGGDYPTPPWAHLWVDPLGETGRIWDTSIDVGFGTIVNGTISGGGPVFSPTSLDLSYDSSIVSAVAAAQMSDQAEHAAAVIAHEALYQSWLSTTYQAWVDECNAVDERNAAKLGFDVLKPYRMSGRSAQIEAMNQWLEQGLSDMHLNREILAFPYDVSKMHDPDVAAIDLSHGQITEGSRVEVDDSLAYNTWTLIDVTTETEPPSGGGGF